MSECLIGDVIADAMRIKTDSDIAFIHANAIGTVAATMTTMAAGVAVVVATQGMMRSI